MSGSLCFTDHKEGKLDEQMLVEDLDQRQHQFLLVLSFERQGGEPWKE